MISPDLRGRDIRVLLEDERDVYAELLQVDHGMVRLLPWGGSSRTLSVPMDSVIAAEVVDALPRLEVLKIAARQAKVFSGPSAFRAAHTATAAELTAKQKAKGA